MVLNPRRHRPLGGFYSAVAWAISEALIEHAERVLREGAQYPALRPVNEKTQRPREEIDLRQADAAADRVLDQLAGLAACAGIESGSRRMLRTDGFDEP